MGTNRRITETQLERAKEDLALRVQALEKKGIAANKFKDDPKWRELNGRVRQISSRLRKVAELESLNAEVARLKEERLARMAAEKAEHKAGAHGKKAKAAEKEKEKDKGKGEAKAAKKEKPPKKKEDKEKGGKAE